MGIINKLFLKNYSVPLLLFFVFLLISACGQMKSEDEASGSEYQTWAERLGFPSGKKVLIFHADDAGMVEEANEATMYLLENNLIQSAAAMPPCPAYEDMIEWAIENPQFDVGIHLTLTNEWGSYHWGTVADPEEVPGLLTAAGNMHKGVREVVLNATPEEVETELRAQIEKTLALGYRPDHMDTHMGTLFGSNAFTEVYLKLAEEYRIPAMVIDFGNPKVVEAYKESGYPVSDDLLNMIDNYSLPKLDNFSSVPKGESYEDMRANFFEQVRSLEPGLTEIIFHPQYATEKSKTITGSWQQRQWEVDLFADPVVRQFFEDEGLIFTNWKEIMERFDSL